MTQRNGALKSPTEMQDQQTKLQRRLWELLIKFFVLFLILASFGHERVFTNKSSVSPLTACRLPHGFERLELALIGLWVLAVLFGAAKALKELTTEATHLLVFSVVLDHVLALLQVITFVIIFFGFFPYCTSATALLPAYLVYLLKGFANISSMIFSGEMVGIVAMSLLVLFVRRVVNKILARSWDVAFVVFDIALFFTTPTLGLPEISIFLFIVFGALRHMYSIFAQ